MTVIKPISDLRNHTDQISTICHEDRTPVFITKNGESDLVVMSQALYDQQQALLNLYRKLDAGERSLRRSRGATHTQAMKRFKKRLGL